ncbi:MAG TPA: PAS domain-containing protein, partial [Rhodocyclaceae bacterium]
MEPRLSILAEAMESLPYAVAIADARQTDAPIVYANAAFSTLTGYPRDELLGRNCRLLQGPCSDRTKVAELRTAVALGREGQITLLNYRKDGTLFWNRVRIKPLRDSTGQLTHYVSTHSDIASDAADHDAATRKSPLLTKFAVQLPGALFTLEQKTDGQIDCRFIGAQAHAILGQSPLGPNGCEPLRAALGEAEHSRLLSTLASSARDMSPWRQEFRIQSHEPEPHWLEINATPESIGDGNIVWYGYLSDITARKRLENELRLAASVFDNAQGAVVITDANGIVLEVNPIFSEVTGYSRDEIVGRTPALLNSGRHSPSFYREMWQALQQAGYWRGEIWNKRKDGELYAELLTITGVRDSAGQISHYVGTFTDVTLLREHQSRLRDLAYHDPLTHLPNRTLLQDRISQALASASRSGRRLAVCYLDLDNFKPINDALGHACGDQLLIQVAARLQGSLREGDTVARL